MAKQGKKSVNIKKGDQVRVISGKDKGARGRVIAETRPLSATKRWRLVEIAEKAK